MLALGALVGIVLAFFSVLENRTVGLLGLAAAALNTNIFTIGLVTGFFVASGVISQVEGEDFAWYTKVNWYVTGIVFGTIVTTIFVTLTLPYLSPMMLIQILIILRTIAWIWAMIEERDRLTVWDFIGIGIVLFLAWFGIRMQMMSLAFIYFSAMRLNLSHDVKKTIKSTNTKAEMYHIDSEVIPYVANWISQFFEVLISGLFDCTNIRIEDDDELISPITSLRSGYSDGAQFVIIALLASQRDLLNTILMLDLQGDATYMFVALCICIVFLTRFLLGQWFINIYNALSSMHIFTLLNYASVAFNIVVMLYISPYALMYCLLGIFVCNMCNKFVKRISLTALPVCGIML